MSGEEVPFKSMKITLSDDVLEKTLELMKTGSFRSYSNVIEECIRAVYDVSFDMTAIFSSVPKGQRLRNEDLQEAFRNLSSQFGNCVQEDI